MASRAVKPVTVTLGAQASPAQQRVASGQYASLSEVVRAGLRALDREDRTLDAVMTARIAAALADPALSVSQSDVFAALRAHHDRQ